MIVTADPLLADAGEWLDALDQFDDGAAAVRVHGARVSRDQIAAILDAWAERLVSAPGDGGADLEFAAAVATALGDEETAAACRRRLPEVRYGRALRRYSEDAQGHEHGRDGRFVGQGGGGESGGHGGHRARVVGQVKQALARESQARQEWEAKLSKAHAGNDPAAWRELLHEQPKTDPGELRSLFNRLPGDAYEPRSQRHGLLAAKPLDGDTWLVNDNGFVHTRGEAQVRLLFDGEIPGHDRPDPARELARIANARRLEKEFPQSREELQGAYVVPTPDGPQVVRGEALDEARRKKAHKVTSRKAAELLWDALPADAEKMRGGDVYRHLNGAFSLKDDADGPKLVKAVR